MFDCIMACHFFLPLTRLLPPFRPYTPPTASLTPSATIHMTRFDLLNVHRLHWAKVSGTNREIWHGRKLMARYSGIERVANRCPTSICRETYQPSCVPIQGLEHGPFSKDERMKVST